MFRKKAEVIHFWSSRIDKKCKQYFIFIRQPFVLQFLVHVKTNYLRKPHSNENTNLYISRLPRKTITVTLNVFLAMQIKCLNKINSFDIFQLVFLGILSVVSCQRFRNNQATLHHVFKANNWNIQQPAGSVPLDGCIIYYFCKITIFYARYYYNE